MKEDILELLRICEKYKSRIHLSLLCYLKEDGNIHSEDVMYSEFFSKKEFNQLLYSCQSFGIYTIHYSNQDKFIQAVIDGSYFINEKDIYIVYDTTQKGKYLGKNSLIPAFCDLHNIYYTGPNAYINSLLSSKYDWVQLLSAHNISTPQTKKYSNRFGWLDTQKLTTSKVIVKPNSGCASIGIGSDSVRNNDLALTKFMLKKAQVFEMPILAQEFISGYEVEVPVIISNDKNLILPPVGISIDGIENVGNNFLAFDLVLDDIYKFYDFTEYNTALANELIHICNQIIEILELSGHCRIDVRISSDNGKIYITDINAHPHIVLHSSFAEAFNILDIDKNNILPALIGNVLKNNNYN